MLPNLFGDRGCVHHDHILYLRWELTPAAIALLGLLHAPVVTMGPACRACCFQFVWPAYGPINSG